ncbi:hypothetical protein EIP91_004160 [Steccherinum ochraceum]|uniref:Calcineurin-like phosphoesterase domain-containing protein n=1 Tax=Steccherinum ochraceum TaxID=92696 RepID=A0A4R0RWJ5_9APHY|nr:hypothetical protein EIP91_004160 [Steccherinum ochraceum]
MNSETTETARVYIEYDVLEPPPHPGDGWTRFVCISDTHSRTYRVPHGDVLLHSGDLSSWGHLPQLKKTLKWIKELPHPIKVYAFVLLIAGNHDLCLDDDWGENGPFASAGEGIPSKDIIAAQHLMRCEKTRQAGVYYLEYEPLEITVGSRVWKLYGSPAAPRYALGAFQYDGTLTSSDGSSIYAQIPTSTEILLTHTPAHGICDVTKRGKHAGCYALRSRLDSPELSNCRLHVFGHIHEAQGAEINPANATHDRDNIRVSVNAAMHEYNPVIVDLMN